MVDELLDEDDESLVMSPSWCIQAQAERLAAKAMITAAVISLRMTGLLLERWLGMRRSARHIGRGKIRKRCVFIKISSAAEAEQAAVLVDGVGVGHAGDVVADDAGAGRLRILGADLFEPLGRQGVGLAHEQVKHFV